MSDQFLGKEEVARFCGVSPRTLAAIWPRLPVVMIGLREKVRRSDLYAWLASQTEQARAATVEEATMFAATARVRAFLAGSTLGDGDNPRALLPILADLAVLTRRDDGTTVLLAYNGLALRLHTAPTAGDPKLAAIEIAAISAGLDVLSLVPSEIRADVVEARRDG